MNLLKLAETNKEYIIELRRHFHQHPELSFKEFETTEKIAEELRKLGLQVEYLTPDTGLCATLKGNKKGKCVLLRSDIDALPVKEETGFSFASKNEGMMHACGHDAHMAMMLGAAKILTEIKNELHGDVKFYFQPAEEIALGAKQGIAKGVLDGVDACFGTHVWGQIDAKKLSIEAGVRMASSDLFVIEINGKSAHGSEPHLGADAIAASAAIITNFQSIVSRFTSPLEPLVITVGKITGGKACNILADQVVLEGTVRTLKKELQEVVEQEIRKISKLIADIYGCDVNITYNRLTIPVDNRYPFELSIAKNAAISLFGEDAIVPFDKIMASEDFSFILDQIPGVWTFLGGRNPEIFGSSFSNHHPQYTIDENVLVNGAAFAAQFAYDYLSCTKGDQS